MAKTTKKARTKKPDEVVEDAELVDETPSEENEAPAVEQDFDKSDATSAESVEDTIAEEVVPAVEEPLEESPVQEPALQDQPRRGGLIPLLIGGLAAGGIGYGVETYLDSQQVGPSSVELAIAEQTDRLSALEAALSELPPPVELGQIEDRITQLELTISEQIEAISTDLDGRFAALDERITEVEKRPSGDGTLSDTALEAYERELDALRAELGAQRDEMLGLAQQAEADLAAARAEAAALEQEALSAAQSAAARAALNRVAAALETGAPFADALDDLSGHFDAVPTALVNASDTGVLTQADLADAFPAAARSALAAARSEGVSGESGGLGGFLRRQFDVRSTAPREGDDPDAILSRAQAAVEQGHLTDALAEIAALPEVARAAMTDWTAGAESRAAALSAVADLTQTLNN